MRIRRERRSSGLIVRMGNGAIKVIAGIRNCGKPLTLAIAATTSSPP